MDRDAAKSLVDALAAGGGIVAMVGAGGKKSTMQRLLEAHRALGTRRILLTSTVQIAASPNGLDVAPLIIEDGDAGPMVASVQERNSPVFVAGPSQKPGRLSGLPRSLVPELHEQGGFAVSLVKADGARMRMMKGPSEDEPVLPDGTTTILPIVSARVFGRVLDQKLVHRPERLTKVIDAAEGTRLGPEHVARWLSHPEGALRRAGAAEIVPIINMVDDPERLSMAREAARSALARTDRFDRVALTSMTAVAPLIETIKR